MGRALYCFKTVGQLFLLFAMTREEIEQKFFLQTVNHQIEQLCDWNIYEICRVRWPGIWAILVALLSMMNMFLWWTRLWIPHGIKRFLIKSCFLMKVVIILMLNAAKIFYWLILFFFLLATCKWPMYIS